MTAPVIITRPQCVSRQLQRIVTCGELNDASQANSKPMKTVEAVLNISRGLLPTETAPIVFSLREEEADRFELSGGLSRRTIRARFADPSRDLGPLRFGVRVTFSIEGIPYKLLDVDLDAKEFALKVT